MGGNLELFDGPNGKGTLAHITIPLARERESRVSPRGSVALCTTDDKAAISFQSQALRLGFETTLFKDLMKRRRMRLPSLLMSVAMPRQFDCSLTRAVSSSGCS